MAGAPVNFGGRVFPNPDNIQPKLDTDPIQTDTPSTDAQFSIQNAALPNAEFKREFPEPKLAPRTAPKPAVKPTVKPSAAFDPVGDILKEYRIPNTRENYVALNHIGTDSQDVTPEEDAELPKRHQMVFPTHEELMNKSAKPKK